MIEVISPFGFELYADTALVLSDGSRVYWRGWRRPSRAFVIMEMYWPAFASVMGVSSAGFKSQHNHVIAGLLAINNFEGRVGNIICLGCIESLFDLDQGVCHKPVHFAPGIHDLFSCGVARSAAIASKRYL